MSEPDKIECHCETCVVNATQRYEACACSFCCSEPRPPNALQAHRVFCKRCSIEPFILCPIGQQIIAESGACAAFDLSDAIKHTPPIILQPSFVAPARDNELTGMHVSMFDGDHGPIEGPCDVTTLPSAQQAKPKPRGFATMPKETIAEISRKGGKAAHEKGVAYRFNSETGKEAGKKGGIATRTKKHGSEP